MLDSIVTFRKPDATIKIDTWEADPAGDIWFQFKTTATDGTILHNIGDPDYIKVDLFSKYFYTQTYFFYQFCHLKEFLILII